MGTRQLAKESFHDQLKTQTAETSGSLSKANAVVRSSGGASENLVNVTHEGTIAPRSDTLSMIMLLCDVAQTLRHPN